jgi:site-specific recombinase XerD
MDDAPEHHDLDHLLAMVRAAWEGDDAFSPQTRLRSIETVTRFTTRASVQGARTVHDLTPAICAGFVYAHGLSGRPPELATQHARRTILRTYFRTLRDLGLAPGDPTLDLTLPPRTTTAARPLTDDEVIACRYAVRLGRAGATSLQRAVCWALAEATAITSEITQVRVADLDDEDQPRWVRLMGSKRAEPRLGQLTDWGSRIVRRQVEVLLDAGASTTVLLTYRGRAVPGQHVAQASAANAIAETLRAAGLGDEADVRPASVRNWAGRRLYVDGMPIEQVALRLGARSLDAVVADIALDWRAA